MVSADLPTPKKVEGSLSSTFVAVRTIMQRTSSTDDNKLVLSKKLSLGGAVKIRNYMLKGGQPPTLVPMMQRRYKQGEKTVSKRRAMKRTLAG